MTSEVIAGTTPMPLKELTMLGLDPGLSNTGFAVANVNLANRRISKVLRVGLIETERQKLKQVRQTSDNLRRARHLFHSIQAVIRQHDVSLIAMEMCSASQHIYPTFSFGVMIGVAASLQQQIIEVLPHELKRAATGDKRATKAEIIAWAVRKCGNRRVGWPVSTRANQMALMLRGLYVTKAAEHPADALAAIEAALNTEQFRLASSLIA
jgi:Holliday junction resolvasome RuvABC endonuclease subunit